MTATLGTSPALSHLSHQTTSGRTPLDHGASTSSGIDQSLMLDLIANSEVVSHEILGQVADLARMRNSQVIDVLFESGFIAASDRRAFIEAASAIRSSTIFKPWALQTLKQALHDFLPFNKVLEMLELHPSNAFADSALGELAISCQLIDRTQFNQARLYSLARGMSVGQSLNRCCGLPVAIYKILIDGLARFATGQISEEQLCQRVKNARYENTLTGGVSGVSANSKLAHSTLGFGLYASNRDILEVLDLLVQSNLISEITVLGLMEAALQNRIAFESVWEDCSPVPALVLQNARAMQKLIASGQMSPQQAVANLKEMKAFP